MNTRPLDGNEPLPQRPEPREPLQQRLAQLFRMAQREGRIHPLQHLIERYRRESEEARR